MTTEQQASLTFDPNKLAVWSVILAVTLTMLVVGRTFLIPLTIAILFWSLLDALRELFLRIAPGKHPMPGWIAMVLAILTVVLANALVYAILIGQVDALVAAAPVYQANFAELTTRLAGYLGVEQLPTVENMVGWLDLGGMFSWIGASAGTLLSHLVLIAIYVGFLLAEQHRIPDKLARLQRDAAKASQMQTLATDISSSVQKYIWIKTLMSLLTGVASYIVLFFVGVDFAAIWALLIFFLNFIPTVGSVVGVVFPALLTLVQFDTLVPFFVIAVGLGLIQFVIGNVLEPAVTGRTLNLSPFMVILSLTFWGALWGVPGMFLSVPLMVVTGIVCSHFAGLRWIAVLLSADGHLMGDESGAQEITSV
jgi:predicted PurR-regulated permease PerM